MKFDEAEIDRHVADLYRAAAGEIPWNVPLEGMVALFDAWGVYLHGARLADGAVAFGYEAGHIPPEASVELIRRYHRIDPRVGMLMPLPAGQWVSCHEHFDEDFVARDPFYQEFLIPFGGRYVSGVKVYQDDDIVAFLGIHRGRGMVPLSAAEVALGKRFGHHIQTALGLWRRQRRRLQEVLVGNALLARLGHPILLIDEQLQVQYCNAAAQQLIDTDDRLELRGGMLACAGPERDTDLRLALRSLRLGTQTSYRTSDAAPNRAVVRAGDGVGRAALVLLLSALRPAETMGAFGPSSLAMMLVHDPDVQRAPDPFVIAASFDLTPAEGKVAARIAAGDTAQEIARSHGVALSTVRSQLSTVFQKVGVRRQPELAGALASIPSFGVETATRIHR